MPNEHDQQATRQRLILAAGEVFAQHGFRAATVRDICRRAGANVASINYHFGDKARLYAEVLRYAHTSSLERYPYTLPSHAQMPPAERLQYFVESYLQRLFDRARPAWQGRLFAREMAQPTSALDQLIDAYVRPQHEYLTGLMASLLPKGTPRREAMLCARSLLGQCLFYYYGKAVVERLDGQPVDDPARVKPLAAHILKFTLAAISQWDVPEKKAGGRRKTATQAGGAVGS